MAVCRRCPTCTHGNRPQLCATLWLPISRYEGAGLSGVKSEKAPGRTVAVSGVAPMMSPSTMSRAGFSVSSVSVRNCASKYSQSKHSHNLWPYLPY